MKKKKTSANELGCLAIILGFLFPLGLLNLKSVLEKRDATKSLESATSYVNKYCKSNIPKGRYCNDANEVVKLNEEKFSKEQIKIATDLYRQDKILQLLSKQVYERNLDCTKEESQIVCVSINLRVKELTGKKNNFVSNEISLIYTRNITAELESETEAKNQALQKKKEEEINQEAELYLKELQSLHT